MPNTKMKATARLAALISSLPHEIRQMMLLYTYPSDHDALLIVLRLRTSALKMHNPWLLWLKAYKEIKRWIAQLGSLDDVIADDVNFVDKVCCEEAIWPKITEHTLGGIRMRMKELADTRDHGGLLGRIDWNEKAM